ncbi:MAG: type II secretion system protein GspM [Massilia sp.]
MSTTPPLVQLRERASAWWLARSEQERRYLVIGGAIAIGALIYAFFIGPAIEGRAALDKSLPELRQQAAQMQAMALEAGQLARQAPAQVVPMTSASLTASLTARSMKAESLGVTSEYAKVQLNGVAFANLVSWLDALRREQRIGVQEAAVTGQDNLGHVNAVLTLRQDNGSEGR